MITTEKIHWVVDGEAFQGHAAWNSSGQAKKPAVLVHHSWFGQTAFECARAYELAQLGYVGVAMDVYGRGKNGKNPEECSALMTPLVKDRDTLLKRLVAGLDAVKGMAVVDATQVAAIGFCFGGLCVLDMARAGVGLLGVAAFHAILPPSAIAQKPITAKILAFHGYDDRLATREQMMTFCEEMSTAGADWQLHVYGGAMHSFTDPKADDANFGAAYNSNADRRSRETMQAFLASLFNT